MLTLDDEFVFVATDGAAYCLGAVNRDCWYLYTLNPYASPAGHSLSALLAGASEGDDGFGASDGEEGTDGSGSDAGSDGAESSDDSLDMPSSLSMTMAGLNKRNLTHRFPVKVVSSSRGQSAAAAQQHYNEPDQTLEIMMSELDPEVMKIFTKKCSSTAAEATEVTHLFQVHCIKRRPLGGSLI